MANENVFGFTNAPLINFAAPETSPALKSAFAKVRREVVGRTFYPIIGGEQKRPERFFTRTNPSATHETIGTIGITEPEDANRAIVIAGEAQKAWANRSQEERAHILMHAADLLQEDQFFFLALMALEVGKPTSDGVGEIQEAIDFLRYYAKASLWFPEMDASTLVQPPGERNEMHYRPLGVGVSIQPWNFPVAISIGPAAAALVMGNAVLYKPAEESSVVGYYVTKLFHRAGVPPEVLHYLPGEGEVVGNHLVRHSKVRFISFTGSGAVGQTIKDEVHLFNRETIYTLPTTEQYPKRIATLETGGKGAVYVDADADPDEVVAGSLHAAFSNQGQKCSADTRLIIHTDVFDTIVSRLAHAIESVTIGPPEDGNVNMGPVISREAYDRLDECITQAAKDGTTLARGKIPRTFQGTEGLFVRPMLVGNPSPDSKTAQNELFGPILAVFRVNGIDEAIELTNSTSYGLTSGIYSRNGDHIDQFVGGVDVGNIYVNKTITGAKTGQNPFGGIKMSGNGSKTGHWLYLLSFVNLVAVSINTARRGHVIQ